MKGLYCQNMTEIALNPEQLGNAIAREIEPGAAHADATGCLAERDLEVLRESKYHTLSIPCELGGYGYSLRECVAAQIELAQGNASLAMLAAMQLQVFGHESEVRTWPEKTFARHAALAVKDGALFNSAASEPDLGSPSRGGIFHTAAINDTQAGDLVVNGHKTWVTGGKHLSYLLVRLMYEEQPAVVLIPNHLPGIRWEHTWKESLSLRASESDDVFFENVRVPYENLVKPVHGENPENFWFPLMLASVYLGVAIGARNKLIEYARERTPTALGKPIATLPSIQRRLGELEIPLQAAQALLFSVAEQWDPARLTRSAYFPAIVAAKQSAVSTACSVTEQVLEIVGGRGLTVSYPFERYFRDVRAGMMQPPAADSAHLIIGKSLLFPA